MELQHVSNDMCVPARPSTGPERPTGQNSDWIQRYAVKVAACELAVLFTALTVAGSLPRPLNPGVVGESGATWGAATAPGEVYWHRDGRADGERKAIRAAHTQQLPGDGVGRGLNRERRGMDAIRPGARKTSIRFRGPVRGVAFSPDGTRLAIASQDGDFHAVTLWEWDSPGSRGNELPVRHPGPVHCVAYGPDGRHVASGSADGTLIIFDHEAPRMRHRISARQGSVRCLAFSPDGLSIATGGDDGTVVIWNRHTGERSKGLLPDPGSPVTCLTYNPQGDRLFVGGWDRRVRTFDVRSSDELWTSAEHGGPVSGLAVDPDGRWVASAADRTVRLLSALDGKQAQALSGHGGPVSSVAFGPKRGQVVSGGADHTLRVWDAASGAAVGALRGHTGAVLSVAVSRDGRYVASGSADGTAKVWEADSIEAPAEPDSVGGRKHR